MEMEELKALFRVCVHIKSNGIRCGSPALTGSNFCWQHMGGGSASALARARSTTHDTTARLNFAYPGDRESIQHNFFLIAEALNDGKIDTRTANTYIRLFRAAEQNLHRWEKKQKNAAKIRMNPLETGVPHVSTLRRGPSEASHPTQSSAVLNPTQSSAVLNPTQSSEASNPTSSCHPEASWCHPEAEFVAQATNAAEGPAVPSPSHDPDQPPLKPANRLSDDPDAASLTDAANVILSEVEESAFPSPAQPTHPWGEPDSSAETGPNTNRENAEIDWTKYDHRFREIDRLYSNHPDYADRIHAAIQEIKQSEAAARGCPMSRF